MYKRIHSFVFCNSYDVLAINLTMSVWHIMTWQLLDSILECSKTYIDISLILTVTLSNILSNLHSLLITYNDIDTFHDNTHNSSAFEGGWFHTGDLAVNHGNGRIEIKDRSKDIIISGLSKCNQLNLLYESNADDDILIVQYLYLTHAAQSFITLSCATNIWFLRRGEHKFNRSRGHSPHKQQDRRSSSYRSAWWEVGGSAFCLHNSEKQRWRTLWRCVRTCVYLCFLFFLAHKHTDFL